MQTQKRSIMKLCDASPQINFQSLIFNFEKKNSNPSKLQRGSYTFLNLA